MNNDKNEVNKEDRIDLLNTLGGIKYSKEFLNQFDNLNKWYNEKLILLLEDEVNLRQNEKVSILLNLRKME